jgi:hypothetical protein
VRDDRDPNHARLPFSYRLTIVVTVALMFALGLVYFGLRNQRITTSFQVYGSRTITQDLPAVFRLVQFDNDGSQGNLPVKILDVTVNQNGREISSGKALQDVASVPADARIMATGLKPGEATLHFDVKGWTGERRKLEVMVDVLPPQSIYSGARLRPGLEAPIDATRALMDLSLPAGGMVEGLDNQVWLRFAGPDGRPADVHPNFTLADSENVQAEATGRLGITPISLDPRGPNQNLVIEVPFRDDTIIWEEMIAPGKLARLVGASLLWQTPPPVQHALTLETDGSDRTFYCTLWQQTTPISIARVDTLDGVGKVIFDYPAWGLFWVTCDDHFLSSNEFTSERAVYITEDSPATLGQIIKLAADEPFFANWPELGQLTPAEFERAAAYFQDRLQPHGQEISQLLNTYDGDSAELRTLAGHQRDTVLILWGLAGVGLLLWAVAVTIRQHKRLARSFQEFQDGEEVGDDLALEGITRRRSFVPALLVAFTFLANLAALIWLFRLIFF